MSNKTALAEAGQPPHPTMRREFVDPAMAAELLATSDRNRKLQEGWVQELVGMLRDGRFKEIGDTIRLSWEKRLLDGQHRLTAIVRSGIGVWMWIVEGLDPASQDVMDRGRKRTVGDVLTIHGYAQGTMLAAAVKWVVVIGEGRLAKAGKSASKNERMILQFGPDETLEALAQHSALEKSLRIGSAIKHASVRYPPSLAVGMHYLMALKAGTDVADDFFEQLTEGTNLQRQDPVWTLRDQLQRDEGRRIKRQSIDIAAWTIKAWNAWRANQYPVKVLKYYPGYFPVLED